MVTLNNVVPLVMRDRHTRDIHIEVLKTLIESPKTYNQIHENISKENGEPYSKSYIRKALSELQYNDLVRKEYLTHKFTFYVINEWEVFKSTWDKRRKRIKRNLFNNANRELPTLEEMLDEEDEDYY